MLLPLGVGVLCLVRVVWCTVKPVYSAHSRKDHKLVFKIKYRLMQVKSIAECSNAPGPTHFLLDPKLHVPTY